MSGQTWRCVKCHATITLPRGKTPLPSDGSHCKNKMHDWIPWTISSDDV